MTKQNQSDRAIVVLIQKLEEAESPTLASDKFAFSQWALEVEGILTNLYSEDSRQLNNFKHSLQAVVGIPSNLSDRRARQRAERDNRKLEISYAKSTLRAILSEIELFGVPAVQDPMAVPKTFIAHGGRTEALSKLQKFIAALGITALVAEEEPSEGRSVDEQVEWCLDNADCAIILGTADDQNLKDGKLYPRPSVCIEIGRVQERFPGRVIYLLEEEASFPSNITEKVYERFTQENMEKAYLKVLKELRAFGIIRAISIRSHNV